MVKKGAFCILKYTVKNESINPNFLFVEMHLLIKYKIMY